MPDKTASVSVVIPCYRCATTIIRAVDSIAQQTLKPAEVILVDDASGDDTINVLHEIQSQYDGWVTVISLDQNAGAASARNAGWARASQPYIAFLDSDDTWHPRKIEIQYAYMVSHHEVSLSGHGHRVMNLVDTGKYWELGQLQAATVGKWPLLFKNKFVTPSIMVRTNINHRFLAGRRHMEDHLLLLDVVCDGGRIDRLDVDLAATYKRSYGESGLSSNLWGMQLSDFNNYQLLHARGRLSFLSTYALLAFSFLKFLRRLYKVFIWRILYTS